VKAGHNQEMFVLLVFFVNFMFDLYSIRFILVV
jgi:hypothetical protein